MEGVIQAHAIALPSQTKPGLLYLQTATCYCCILCLLRQQIRAMRRGNAAFNVISNPPCIYPFLKTLGNIQFASC
jgi:hypothetical protein